MFFMPSPPPHPPPPPQGWEGGRGNGPVSLFYPPVRGGGEGRKADIVSFRTLSLHYFRGARFLPGTVLRGPRRVRALVRVRCPRTGRLRLCRIPR